MAQATNPSIAANQTGTQYRTQDNDRYAAHLTTHSGTSRPSYAVAGTLWLDTISTPWVLKMYDGADDISIGTVNASTNAFNASNAASTASTIAMTAAINEASATVASASTADIGAAAGNYVSVTGTTTITALGTVQAGTRRTVRFAGALTLTHNGTSLILPGAANIVTVAGDIAVFISLGSGNWFCAAFQRVSSVAGFLSEAQNWTKPQRSTATHTATTGGSVTIDLEAYQNFDYTLSSNITFTNPTLTNVVGQKGTINITPSTYSIAGMGTNWKRIGSTGAPSTITGRGRIDYHVVSTSRVEYSYNDVEA
jgi:hypothetical protein